MPLTVAGITITWLGHAGFRIHYLDKVLYIDPFQIGSVPAADAILITHPHYDHCSIADIMKLARENTKIICTADSQSAIAKVDAKINLQLISAGDKISFGNIEIQAVPAYNANKPFHAKSEEWVGYVIKIGNVSIYHAGDTDFIEEMKKLTGHARHDATFIALLPVGGKFTMNAQEAFEAAKALHADIVVPMHYGTLIGTRQDAEKLKNYCAEEDIEVNILEKDQ